MPSVAVVFTVVRVGDVAPVTILSAISSVVVVVAVVVVFAVVVVVVVVDVVVVVVVVVIVRFLCNLHFFFQSMLPQFNKRLTFVSVQLFSLSQNEEEKISFFSV